MGLQEYQRKRDFGRTPEPRGRGRGGGGELFVIHKHAARRLHYDLRLEHDGVLLSWAVPKGPSLDPGEKRLAVQVEDHPVEYAEFEGIIPEGAYGAGPSALWDRGQWEPLEDVAEGLKRGKLRFRLQGERLHGAWNLVRMAGSNRDGKNWLLIKQADEAAGTDGEVTATGPDSVKSGRSLEEIAQAPDAPPEGSADRGQTTPASRTRDATAAGPPEPFTPQLATLVKEVPRGDDWLHEIKFDGYRILCWLEGGKARLLTRNGKDWTERFIAVARAAEHLPVENAVLDGEVVALDRRGRSDFQTLQNALQGGPGVKLHYYLFDLPYCDGENLSAHPIEQRKARLRELLAEIPDDALRYSDHVKGQGEAMYREACRQGLEGLISKRAGRPYARGRSRDWVKTKCVQRQEFVIGGYTDPQGSRQHFGALLLGYHDAEGALRYAGRVGTGFSATTLRELSPKLQRRRRSDAPFSDPPRGHEARGAHWVEPELVAEIEFTEWTSDGRLRHPAFQGLREDKPPARIGRERPVEEQPAPARSGDNMIAGIRLSNPQRILFPDQGVSKQALAEYYATVADWILPHIVNRPVSLVRCPQGRQKQCFFQRHLTEAMPDALRSVAIEEKEKTSQYVVIPDLKGLISLVQLGVLELHPWGARADNPERPDLLVFDLDPGPGVDWKAVVEATVEVRERLAELGLESFLKATGGKGLHVVVPLTRRQDWDTAKGFARALAEAMAADSPKRYTASMSKQKRQGRIFLDYLRNGRSATAVAPYSTRARAGAPVATPLGWDELAGLQAPNLYNVDNLPRRLASLREDPWAGYFELRQSITVKMRRRLGMP